MTSFALERVADAVYWTDAAGTVVDVNAAACRLLGYTRDELIGMTVPGGIEPEMTRGWWADLWQRLERQGTAQTEGIQRAKDGRRVPVEVLSNLIRFGDRELNCAWHATSRCARKRKNGCIA